MENITILIVGNGGREHSLAWKIAQSPLVNKIYCAPGNPGIAQIAECIDISAQDIEGLYNFAKQKDIDLTVVGPEDPLVDGIVDRFEAGCLKIFGPTKKAAMLEGSKVFSKNLMRKHGIPTAEFKVFDNYKSAAHYISSVGTPVVIKTDGLAKGKGTFVCKTEKEAIHSLDMIMNDKVFGKAGDRVVIEEFLQGEEVSVLAFTDGRNILVMETAQDHKTIYNGDKGPNTGGMGAYSPAPLTDKFYYQIEKQILVPTIHAMKREWRPYKGMLYAGIMITTHDPKVKVLEFNVRFGDPETQPLIMRMQSDLVPLLIATVNETLDTVELQWSPRPVVCVVAASKGYPDKYEIDKEIIGLDKLKGLKDIHVFHAGTGVMGDKIVTKGGRVLSVAAIGNNIKEAREKVYNALAQIKFEGAYWRTDIATKAIDGRIK